MKSFVFAAALFGTLLTGISAVAQETPGQETPATQGQVVLSCTVEVQGAQPEVNLMVGVQSETNSDFVILQLNDKGEQSLFFTQMEKGAVANSLAQGNLTGLMLLENFSSDAGVIRNAGIFTVSFEGTTGSGLFAAKGNIYPLTCTKN